VIPSVGDIAGQAIGLEGKTPPHPFDHGLGGIDLLGNARRRRLDIEDDGVGFVPAVNLVSRVEVLFFSQNGTASWWQIWRWPQAIRFGRIGKEID
jgi:hypothetical protein